MTLVLAYLAGLLTLLNPCVLPILPAVLASASGANRLGPLWLLLGLSTSFVTLGVALARIGPGLGLAPEAIASAAALILAGFGLILLVPTLNARFATATGQLAARADAGIIRLDMSRPQGLFVGGMLLGAVWSPCIGPTLGGAIALAATGERLEQAAATMGAFAAGVSTLLIALAFGLRGVLARHPHLLRALAQHGKTILGITFLATGLALWAGLHQRLEVWILQTLPDWFNDLSILI